MLTAMACTSLVYSPICHPYLYFQTHTANARRDLPIPRAFFLPELFFFCSNPSFPSRVLLFLLESFFSFSDPSQPLFHSLLTSRPAALTSLIGQPLFSIFQVDDTALNKSILFQNMLHHPIIPMGVDPYVPALVRSPAKANTGKVSGLPGACHPVDHSVRLRAQPLPIIDPGIGGICLPGKVKGS